MEFFSYEAYAAWARSRYQATAAPEDLEMSPPSHDTVPSTNNTAAPTTLRSKSGGYVLE